MAAVGEDESVNSVSESDNDQPNEAEKLTEEHPWPWPYLASMFEFSGVKNPDTDKKAYSFKCLLCLPKTNYISAFNNSTSNLKKHVYRIHEQHKRKYTELTTASLKRKSLPGASSTNLKQMKLEETKQVSQKSVDNAVLNFIVQGLQPFSVVELPAFQSLVTDLQPKGTVMSRTTVRRKLHNATMLMKEKVKEAMRATSYIATTTDCWSARRRSFIGITAHWLDPSSFKRHSAALACRQLKGSHTFDVLAGALNDIHLEYEIREKIVRTTTDNGSNFIKAFRVFGEDVNNNAAAAAAEDTADEEDDAEDPENEEVDFIDVDAIMAEDDGLQYQLPKHHRCACHLLNLVSSVDANNANKTVPYKTLSRSTFAKSQALWNKASRSSNAAEVIVKHCKLQLVQPNATRWNSFYMAVERILRIIKEQGEGAVRAVCAAFDLPMYSPAEIAFLGEYAKTMAPVAKALDILQGESNIHLGWLLPTITSLISKLQKLRASLKYCKPLIDALLDGVNKRFGEMMSDPELIAASILHPKFKSSWTTDDVVQLGLGYIKEHLPDHDEPLQQPHDSSSTSDEDDFFSNMKHVHTQETTKQLDTYLTCTAGGMDIFKSCPAVAKLSLKLNTALPASAACERLFSAAGLLFSPRRGRIHSQNFENQLLLKLNKAFLKFQ